MSIAPSLPNACSSERKDQFPDEPHKHLSSDGRLSEHVCVSTSCWARGEACSGRPDLNRPNVSLHLSCDHRELENVDMEFIGADSVSLRGPRRLPARTGSTYCHKSLSYFGKLSSEGGCFSNWDEVEQYSRTNCRSITNQTAVHLKKSRTNLNIFLTGYIF